MDSPFVPLFQPGRNCWQTGRAERAAFLVDCESYYRALYHALRQARHSVFVLGWDIDGRIELLRGTEADEAEAPVRMLDLIRWKAQESPDLRVYLNKWNYSVFFMKEREPFSGIKWSFTTSPNVRFCFDYKIPFTACHHQKVVVVDDEIAFCGGMDVALGRWDRRQHHLDVPERADPGGLFRPFRKLRYTPYHDIQLVLTGPAVRIFAQLVRNRWQKAARQEPVPIRSPQGGDRETELWPPGLTPDFRDLEVAVARTLPRTRRRPSIREIEAMYQEEIGRAERFIYIENQYLTSPAIARALNQRLKERPGLRVLVVSGNLPRGFMEHKAMWTGRVRFHDTVEEGIEPGRFLVTYPLSRENGEEKNIHIHSKVMIVDDRSLHVGSANLNMRSMGFDTECDVVIEGVDAASRARIAAVRNNLLREHTGRTEAEIERLVNGGAPLETLIEEQPHSRQRLRKAEIELFRDEILAGLGIKLGDPAEAYVLANMPVRQILLAALTLGFLGIVAAWLFPMQEGEIGRFGDRLLEGIRQARNSEWSLLWVTGLYVASAPLFFPITVLNLTTAIVFGPVYGLALAMIGSLASAACGFAAGRLIGRRTLSMFRPAMEKVRRYAERGGIMGMTMIRLIPVAPFTLVNLLFGMVRAPLGAYMLSTFFGLLPGVFAKAMFGAALAELWDNPEPGVVFYLAGSIFLWIMIIWITQKIYNRYRNTASL